MPMFNDDGFYMGGIHGLWWIFCVALIGALVYYLWWRPSDQRRRPRDTPQQVLQRRLANGDITPDEYEKHKAVLDLHAGSKV